MPTLRGESAGAGMTARLADRVLVAVVVVASVVFWAAMAWAALWVTANRL